MSLAAAQYVRVSTGEQPSSIAMQRVAISDYARRLGYSIVRTYEDIGRTGVVLRERPGLQHLLADVMSGAAGFTLILVHDVSRWGRFQDSDEAAHYEFLCKRAGIPVHYCADAFANDGSLASGLVKAIRRNMAAEFSREIGAKVFEAKRKVASEGFHNGASAGYGLQRLLLPLGTPLRAGEKKAKGSGRVVLAPGDPAEVECVQIMFRLAALGYSTAAICHNLNKRGIPYREGRPWYFVAVKNILTNPKYAGVLTWNRTSVRLYTRLVRNHPAQWVRVAGALPAVVSPALFERVQRQLATKHQPSDAALLAPLRCLLRRKGRLSESLICRWKRAAAVSTYRKRFGSIEAVYALVGYRAPERALQAGPKGRRAAAERERLLRQLETLPGTVVERVNRSHCGKVRLPDGTRVSVRVCARHHDSKGPYWKLFPRPAEPDELWLVALVEGRDLPRMFLARPLRRIMWYRVREQGRWPWEGEQLGSIAEVQAAAQRLRAKG